MLALWSTAQDAVVQTSALVGGMVVLWGAILGIWKAVRAVATAFKRVSKIYDELTPNGGATLRDAINRIEQRQVISEQRQRALATDAACGHFEADSDGLCTWINRTYASMVGREPETLIGTGWILCIHPDDRDQAECEWTAAVAEKREFDIVCRLTNSQTAETFKVRDHAYPLKAADGKLLGFYGTVSRELTRH